MGAGQQQPLLLLDMVLQQLSTPAGIEFLLITVCRPHPQPYDPLQVIILNYNSLRCEIGTIQSVKQCMLMPTSPSGEFFSYGDVFLKEVKMALILLARVVQLQSWY